MTARTPADLFDLSGSRAVILGGTGVLGSSFAECLAAAGAEVWVLGRSAERGNAVVKTIVSSGGVAFFRAVEATDALLVGSADGSARNDPDRGWMS